MIITRSKPIFTARHLLRTAPRTDAHPLIPHAHGTRAGFSRDVIKRPVGKNHPIKNDGIERIRTAIKSLAQKGDPSAQSTN